MIKKFSSQSWIFFLLFAALLFDSCRTDPKTTETPTETGPVVVTSRLRGNPDAINPYRTVSSVSRYVYRHLFPALLTYDPQTTKLAPMLAKSMPVKKSLTTGPWAGGESYTYEIHDKAVWDNGTPVQASDYIFTLKMIHNPKIGGITAAYRGILNIIKDVEVDPDNPRKFTVFTSEPYFDALGATGSWIYPEYVYDPKGLLKDFALTDLSDQEKARELAEKDPRLAEFAEDFTSPKFSQELAHISSCGAYTITEWIPSQTVRLKKKKDWWGEGLAGEYPLLSAEPEEMIFKIIPDQNAAVAVAKEGGVDIIASIPPNIFLDLKENQLIKDQFNYFTPPTFLYNYLGLNGASPKLKEKAVRQALAHVVNIEAIIEDVYPEGLGEPIVSPMSFYDYKNPDLKPIAFDVEKARNLLETNGWKDTDGNGIRDKMIDGKKVELDFEYMLTPGNNVANAIAAIAKEGAKKVGMNIETVTKEFNVLRKAFREKNFELYSSAHGLEPGFYDPYQHWHTQSPGNYFSFGNAESDRLIEELRSTTDPAKQTELYHAFQEILYEEQPIIFVNTAQERILINKKFKNAFGTQLKPGYYENYFHY